MSKIYIISFYFYLYLIFYTISTKEILNFFLFLSNLRLCLARLLQRLQEPFCAKQGKLE